VVLDRFVSCPVGCLAAVVLGVKNRDPRRVSGESAAERVLPRCQITVISYRDEEIVKDLRKCIVKHMEQQAVAVVFSGKVEKLNDLGCSTEWIGW
jgi:hypothetical protein